MSQNQNTSKIISSLSHPISYPFLTTLLYFILLPRYLSWQMMLSISSIVLIGTILFPLILLVLFKFGGIIQDYMIIDMEDRKFPLITLIIISFMLSRLFFKMQLTLDLSAYFFAGAISLLLAYIFLWFRVKLSLHTMGLGSVLGFMICLSVQYQINVLLIMAVIFILFGMIAKSRLDLKAHTLREVLLGFVFGSITQIVILYLHQKM